MIQGLNHGPINKVPAVATASLNLAEFASVNEEKELEVRIPLSIHGDNIECSPSLCVSTLPMGFQLPFSFRITLSLFIIVLFY